MTAQLAPVPVFRGWDNNGNPLAGGQLFTYQAGTTTPQATWTDSTQATPNTNPVILNARGEANVWLDQNLAYKLALQDSLGNQIWTVDNITDIGAGAVFNADVFTTIAGQTAFTISAPSISTNAVTASLDGAVLVATDDYTLIGKTFTLNTPALAGQRLRIAYAANAGTVAVPNGAVTDSSLAVGSIIGSIDAAYARTSSELSAGIIPVNFGFLPGDFRRYGADPTGVAPSDTAIANCIACNSDCFDGQPGGGTYLLATGVTVGSAFPLMIRGQVRWPITTGGGAEKGTKFVLSATANGVSHFNFANPIYGLRIQNIGFTWQNFTSNQNALKFNDDLRYSIIEGCAFIGAGNIAGQSVIGINLSHSSIFSGDVVIRDNFFDALFAGIVLASNSTTVKIIGNEIYGHSAVNAVNAFTIANGGTGYTTGIYNNIPLTGGTGSGATAQITVIGGIVTQVALINGGAGYVVNDSLSASTVNIGPGSNFALTVTTVGNLYGQGIQVAYPATEPALIGNYFEGLSVGVYSNGATYLKQIGNDYGPNVTHWLWAKTTAARMWNTSMGETFPGSGVISGYKDVGNFNTVLSQPATIGDAWFDSAIVNFGNGLTSAHGGLGLFGNAAAAQSTGWGTPVGNAVINNYNITDAGGANSNTNKALAQLIATLKATGILGT